MTYIFCDKKIQINNLKNIRNNIIRDTTHSAFILSCPLNDSYCYFDKYILY